MVNFIRFIQMVHKNTKDIIGFTFKQKNNAQNSIFNIFSTFNLAAFWNFLNFAFRKPDFRNFCVGIFFLLGGHEYKFYNML